MAFELSFENIRPGGDEFDIVLKDVGYAFDADQHPLLRERGKSLYQSLLVIERDPERGILTGDLDALGSYPKGVYVLVNTRLTPKNRRSVFAGMAGVDFMSVINRERSDIDLETIDADRELGLFKCLRKKSEKPPKNMGNWDLAIVIPTLDDPFILYEILCNMLGESKDFLFRQKLPRGKLSRVYGISSDSSSALLMSSITDLAFNGGDYLIWLIYFAIEAVVSGFSIDAIKSFLWKKSDKKDFGSSISDNKSIRLRLKNSKVDNLTIEANTTIKYYIIANTSSDTED